MRRRYLLVTFLPMVLLLGSCVMKSSYDAKEQEAQQLSDSLAQAQGELDKLKSGYDELATSNAVQQDLVQSLKDDLAKTRKMLETSLRPENLIQALTDALNTLQKEINALTAENAELKAEAAALGKPGDDSTPVMEVAPVAQPTAEPAVAPMLPVFVDSQPAADAAKEPTPEGTSGEAPQSAPAAGK